MISLKAKSVGLLRLFRVGTAEDFIAGNCKPIFNLDDYDIPGVPDGMTIDTDGNLWVAVFDGGCLLHINPNTSELLNTIQFPVKQVVHIFVQRFLWC